MSALVTVQQPQALSLFPAQHEWAQMKEAATMLVRSGFLPRAVDTGEKAIAIMLKGREMGIPPMQAFAHIAIVEGKPTMSAELMRAQVFRLVPGAVLDIEELAADGCKIKAGRPGRKVTMFTWGPDDARAAGLLGKQNWQKYPKAMYLARCTAEACRAVFPDALMGVSYTPEEINPELEVNEDGVVEVTAIPKPAPTEPKQQPSRAAPAPRPNGHDPAKANAARVSAANDHPEAHAEADAEKIAAVRAFDAAIDVAIGAGAAPADIEASVGMTYEQVIDKPTKTIFAIADSLKGWKPKT